MSNEGIENRIHRVILQCCGGSNQEFAKHLGINVSTIQKWKGDKAPGGKVLSKIRKIFGVSIDWLLTGEGKPFIKSNPFLPSITKPEDPHNHRSSTTDELYVDDFVTAVTVLQQIWEHGDNGIIEAFKANLQTLARTVRKERQLNRQTEKTKQLEERISNLEKKLETKEAPGDKKGAA